MSDSNGANGNGRRSASISGPEKRQNFLRGNLPECRKQVRVEADVSDSEPLGSVTIIAAGDGRLVLSGPAVPALFARERIEEGDVRACIEINLNLVRWRIESLEVLEGDEPRVSVALAFQAASWMDGSRSDEWGILRQAQAAEPIARMREAIEKILMPGVSLEAHCRRTRREYYGTLIVNPNRSGATQIERARLQALWDRDHPDERMSEAQALELTARSEAGRVVEGFENFHDDDGPIPGTLEGDGLNVEGLVRILSLEALRQPLADLYREAHQDVEAWSFFQQSAPRSSPGTSNTLPTSEASPPS